MAREGSDMADDLRIAGSTAGRKALRFVFNGRAIDAYEGDMVASALLASGIRELGQNLGGGGRGLFCTMGLCQECTVLIDGRVVEACRMPVQAGLAVSSLP